MDVNKAFQCKLAWKIITNQNGMWVSIMRDKYLKRQDFFDTQTRHGDSVVWRNIIRCRDLIRQGLIWMLGDGKDILFWQDNWIENRCLLEIMEIENDDTVDLNLKDSEFIENNKWNT